MRPLLAALALLTLTACSSGDDSADEPPEAPSATESETTPVPDPEPEPAEPTTSGPSPEDDVRAAVQAYSDAFLTGDADAAFDLLTSRCREETGRDQFAAIVTQAGELYGSALPIESLDVQLDGSDRAAVTYTYSVSAINQTDEPWLLEDGAWHNDEC